VSTVCIHSDIEEGEEEKGEEGKEEGEEESEVTGKAGAAEPDH
jgi:hypothetical protein